MDLDKLTQQPESLREELWEKQFLEQIVEAKVQVVREEPTAGPDGWPYLSLRTGQGEEPFIKVVQWCAGRGIGIVINSHKMVPDYVFTYGMLWNFVETGRFVEPAALVDAPELTLDEGSKWGAPTDKYLPPYVRSILKEFLAAQGFSDPRILVVTSGDHKQTDLVFSIESLNRLEERGHKVLAEALSWFLPTHYSLIFAREGNLPPFTDL